MITMEIISREKWGARTPTEVHRTSWEKRTGFMTHWSGTDVEPSITSIQSYHMDVRKWSDIGYNFLISNKTGAIYEGRGWNVVGAHCAGFNTANIGVCIMMDDDSTLSDAAKRSLRWLADQADKNAKKKLNRKLVHKDKGETDCPGPEITAWVHGGMALPGGTPKPTPAPAPAPAGSLPMPPSARMGDGRVKLVKTIQAILNRDNPGSVLIDGVWREKTDAAVRAWQVTHTVPDSVNADGRGDGVFGPACWTYAMDLD